MDSNIAHVFLRADLAPRRRDRSWGSGKAKSENDRNEGGRGGSDRDENDRDENGRDKSDRDEGGRDGGGRGRKSGRDKETRRSGEETINNQQNEVIHENAS